MLLRLSCRGQILYFRRLPAGLFVPFVFLGASGFLSLLRFGGSEIEFWFSPNNLICLLGVLFPLAEGSIDLVCRFPPPT